MICVKSESGQKTQMTESSNSTIMKVFLTSYSDQESESILINSREYVILILALNSPTTSHLMCVPFKDALDMSAHLVQISHSAQVLKLQNNYWPLVT